MPHKTRYWWPLPLGLLLLRLSTTKSPSRFFRRFRGVGGVAGDSKEDEEGKRKGEGEGEGEGEGGELNGEGEGEGEGE